MQLKRFAPTVAALCLCGTWVTPGGADSPFEEQNGESLMRLFADSDHVSVRSWIGDYAMTLRSDVTLAMHWNNERVTIPAIDAPVGSQEAVDAITTASRPISGNAYKDFVKVRNEFEGGLQRGPARVDYYHSAESDYLAQQLAANVNHDFMDRQLNLSVGTSYGWDAIDPLADDDTNTAADHKTTLHWNAVATRILSPTALVRLGVEMNTVAGLQHNAYRNVFAGGSIVPERHPDHRQRRDAFAKYNQYLSNRSSLKLHYRLYNDDWGITSHETGSALSQYVSTGAFVQYDYRYYTQTAARFYRDVYTDPNGVDGYRTGDYRMAPLSSHLFGVSLNLDLGVFAAGVPVLGQSGWRLGYERYFNSNNYSANIIETGLDVRF